MKLINFYKKVVASLGLTTTKDDFIQIAVGDTKTTFTVNGKPLVLPTKDHIDSAVDVDDDGRVVITKVLFNPLNEDVIKGDSVSLKKTKDIIERRLTHAFASIGELLLTLASNPALQKKTSMELNKFLMALNKADNTNIKSVVDEKSIDLWVKIYGKSLEIDPAKGFIKLFLKKGGTDKGTKYNRLAVAGFPILEQLQDADRDTPFFGIKLRNKDITVFKLIHEYVFNNIDDKYTMSTGSNDKESPGFISLFNLYIQMGERLNKILSSLGNIDQETVDNAVLDIKVTEKELEELAMYKGELVLIPNDVELNRKKTKHQPQHHIPPLVLDDLNKTRQVPMQYVNEPQQVMAPVEEMDLAHRILYGNNIPVVPTVGSLNQQMQRPGYPNIQPMQQQPMGYPNMQPQYQQPMYQQPMQQPVYQQPMYQQPMQQQPMGYPNMQPQYQQPMYDNFGRPIQQPQYQQRPQERPIGI